MGDFISDFETNTMLSSLRKGIKQNRNLFVKAKIDPMFDSVRSQVNSLLDDIFQQIKTNSEQKVFVAEFVVKKMENWINSNYASSDDKQKFELIHNNISDAKSKLKTQSYFGFTDVLEIMGKTNEIIEEVQSSIKKRLEFFKTQKNININEFSNTSEKINDIKYRRKIDIVIRIIIFYALLSFGSIIYLFLVLVISLGIIYLFNTLYSNFMQKFDMIDKFIGSFILVGAWYVVPLTIAKNYDGMVAVILLLIFVLIPVRFHSELSDLNKKRINYEKQIHALEQQIETSNISL